MPAESATVAVAAAVRPAGVPVPAATASNGLPVAGRPEHAQVWTATGLERQVFLDRTGRRRRAVATTAALAAVLCALWLAGLVTGALGFSSLPALPSANALASKPVSHASRLAPRTGRHHSFKVATTGTNVPGALAALVGDHTDVE